ncbi:MAG: hypothetical protein NVS4B2_07650 [Chloroflexota bacterium]
MPRDDATLQALGAFIREQRNQLDLTQAQLAERLGWVQERISILENGKYGLPSLPGLAHIATALDVPLSALLEVVGYTPHAMSNGASPQRGHESAALQYTLQGLLEIDAATLKEALNQASDQMAEAMASDKIDAFIFDAPTQSLVALGTSNTPMGRRQHEAGLHRVPIANRGRTVDVYETGTAFCTGDAQSDPEISTGVKETLGVQSMLAVPLHVGGEIQGVLVAESAERDRFSDDEQRFFQAASRWVGMIARRVELTEAMRQAVAEEARRMAADEVITALAHDLGNALTPLKGRLDILQRRLDRDGREHDIKHVKQAVRAVASIQAMVGRLLDSARLDQGLFSLALQPLDLAGLIERVAEEMRGSWETLHVRVADTLEVQGDPMRLTEVLVNLITNSIQHSPLGAPITVTAGAEHRDSGQWAVISITDEGPGIAPDVVSGLFQRFAKGGTSAGLGLGLYLSHRLIEAHGGTLTVESSVGKGTTFWLALPCRGE